MHAQPLPLHDIIRWDIKSWSCILPYWEKQVNWNTVQQCLELGGREGGLSLWLALKGKQTVCSDLEDAETRAAALHRNYNVQHLVSYRNIDATHIPYSDFFDLIVFKSVIGGVGRNGAIDKQQQVFREIYKALKPGGKLLFAENLSASPLHRQLRKRFVNWGDSWRYVNLPELHDFLSPFSSFEIKTTGVSATFGRSEGQRKLLASADKLLFNHIAPARWKYIAYGVAQK